METNKCFEECLIKNLIFQSLSLDTALKPLLSISYSSKGSRKLAKLLIDLNSKIYEMLKQKIKLTNVSSEGEEGTLPLDSFQENLEMTSKRFGTLLSILHMFLGDIVNSQSQYTPAPFIPCLENLVEKYIPGGYIIVKSAWNFNYSFAEISQYIKNMLVYSGISIDNDFPEHLVYLSFPRVEKENVLLHCVFAHEIGHFFNTVKEISNHISIHIEDPKILVTIPSLYSQLLRSIQSWYKELVSDVFGIHLFGPAYFCSFTELGLSFSLLNDASLEHPPALMRLKLMMSVLKNLGFLDYSQDMDRTTNSVDNINYYKFFENWEKFLDTNESLFSNPLYYLISQSVSTVHTDIKGKVKEFIKDNGYSADEFRSEVPPLIERVLKLIPPNEIISKNNEDTKIPNFVSIINSCWMVYSVKMHSLYDLLGTETWEEKFQVKTMLNNLALKAIEYNTINKAWEIKNDNTIS